MTNGDCFADFMKGFPLLEIQRKIFIAILKLWGGNKLFD